MGGVLIVLLLVLIFVSSNPVVYDVNKKFDVDGNLKVGVHSQHTEIIDLKLSKKIADINITLNTAIGDFFVNISSLVTPNFDDLVCFKENKSFYQGNILGVVNLTANNYQIELDRPLDFAFTTLGGCSIREDNWAVDGSVTDQTFVVSPSGLNNVTWDITRVIFGCLGDGVGASNFAPDMSDFFTTDVVTNGIVFRSVNGITKNIFSAKDNFHLGLESYDVSFTAKSKLGLYGVTSRRTFNGMDKNGVTVRLNSNTSDAFELIIRDDLTDMTECHAIAQGNVVDV